MIILVSLELLGSDPDVLESIIEAGRAKKNH
jgi:hypothetical protein